MTLTSVLVGGLAGFGCQITANAVRKVPLSRYPWMHVFGVLVGSYVGYKLPKVEQQLVDECNELRKRNGMTPMVGSNSWIRYRVPIEEENAEYRPK